METAAFILTQEVPRDQEEDGCKTRYEAQPGSWLKSARAKFTKVCSEGKSQETIVTEIGTCLYRVEMTFRTSSRGSKGGLEFDLNETPWDSRTVERSGSIIVLRLPVRWKQTYGVDLDKDGAVLKEDKTEQVKDRPFPLYLRGRGLPEREQLLAQFNKAIDHMRANYCKGRAF